MLEAHSYSAIMVYKETKYLHNIVNYHMTSNTHCSRTCAAMGPLKKREVELRCATLKSECEYETPSNLSTFTFLNNSSM